MSNKIFIKIAALIMFLIVQTNSFASYNDDVREYVANQQRQRRKAESQAEFQETLNNLKISLMTKSGQLTPYEAESLRLQRKQQQLNERIAQQQAANQAQALANQRQAYLMQSLNQPLGSNNVRCHTTYSPYTGTADTDCN